MFYDIHGSAQITTITHHQSIPENSEQYGQRYGQVLILPNLRDRITIRIGQFLIAAGQRLTNAGTKNLHLSKEAA